MSVARRHCGVAGPVVCFAPAGLVLLVLFSAVMVLGVATRLGSAPRHWPRFVIAELHRTLALFSVAFGLLRGARGARPRRVDRRSLADWTTSGTGRALWPCLARPGGRQATCEVVLDGREQR
jgi:hypothetical protein